MLTHSTQAVLLLTAHFAKPAAGDPKPLSPTEWGRFAAWLRAQGLTPETLLAREPSTPLKGWVDATVSPERICALLSRSSALALALEKWQRAGLWVITRSDPDYPARLKKLLRNSSPPLFFGCGNRQLLNRGGLTVVGSRDASRGDLDFARRLGSEAAEAGAGIVSGGARGIDESAMLGALENEGTVVGVLSDRLLKAATSSKYRPALMAQKLVLISPFSPEAGFDVGNAMARNKYVYCLADAAVVVQSGTKGGTWAGALENLKHGWVPVWVKPTGDPASGNAPLVAKGARWLPVEEGKPDIRRLFEKPAQAGGPPQPESLFDAPVTPTENAVGEIQSAFERESALETMAPLDHPIEAAGTSTPGKAADVAGAEIGGEAHTTEREVPEGGNDMSFYEFFLRRMEALTGKEPKTVEQILGELDITKTQLNAWLKRAVSEKRLRKLNKPVRYARHASAATPRQVSIF
jgi:predicted Rossmann fold nucleotide-binding protein DprA/Smf involved in DNA uptake